MSFFKKKTEPTQPDARELVKEAIAYFLVLMTYADGSADDSEINTAVATLNRSYLFANNSVDDDYALLAAMEARMREDLEGYGDHYASILAGSDWKYTAAAMMCDVMMADGSIDEDEEHLLKELAARAGIAADELDGVFSVVLAMRRGWS